MSKTELKYNIEAEIKRINRIIDHKILRGLPYSRESFYHKTLVARLSRMRLSGFLGRSLKQSLKFASSFHLF